MSTTEFETFLQKYPAYKQTTSIDDLRKKDYARLDAGEHVYLDYTGGGGLDEAEPPSALPRQSLP